MSKTYFVYIMSNKSRRLYTGITSDLVARAFQHKYKWHLGSFTGRYRFDLLVYLKGFPIPTKPSRAKKKSRAGVGKRSYGWFWLRILTGPT